MKIEMSEFDNTFKIPILRIDDLDNLDNVENVT